MNWINIKASRKYDKAMFRKDIISSGTSFIRYNPFILCLLLLVCGRVFHILSPGLETSKYQMKPHPLATIFIACSGPLQFHSHKYQHDFLLVSSASLILKTRHLDCLWYLHCEIIFGDTCTRQEIGK